MATPSRSLTTTVTRFLVPVHPRSFSIATLDISRTWTSPSTGSAQYYCSTVRDDNAVLICDLTNPNSPTQGGIGPVLKDFLHISHTRFLWNARAFERLALAWKASRKIGQYSGRAVSSVESVFIIPSSIRPSVGSLRSRPIPGASPNQAAKRQLSARESSTIRQGLRGHSNRYQGDSKPSSK